MSSVHRHDTNTRAICCRKCGCRITFDDKIISINGKKIPLNFSDRKPHECPKLELYKKTAALSLQYDNQENQNKEKNNFESTDGRKSFLNHISEMMEYDNKQQEQIIINQNQIENQQKELKQLLLELARKWS